MQNLSPPSQIPPKARLLIVDEDRILLASLVQLFRRHHYVVTTAEYAADALTELEAGETDLLLVDIDIPGLGGYEFLRDIRLRFPHVVSVVLTGYGSIAGAVEATKGGAVDYLTKPITDEQIRLTIEKAARQQALVRGNFTVRKQLDTHCGLENVVGRDSRLLKVFDLVDAVADSRTTVLLTGESGTGKSLIARSIHRRSARRDKPFVEVSCGALSETLLESELFGHVKGSFTGAIADKPGRFLAAEGGTLFLDEINSASPAMQVKLLRALQERSFEPVGSNEALTVDVRVILASNVDLATRVAEKQFRQDLYYRISVVTIGLPNLRDRAGDIPLLAGVFLRKFEMENRRRIVGVTPDAMAVLQQYPWPGNVRELENAIERAVVLCARPQIDVVDLPETVRFYPPRVHPPAGPEVELHEARPLASALDSAERRIIEAALRRHHYSRQATAAELQINRTTLYKKMRQYRLDEAVTTMTNDRDVA